MLYSENVFDRPHMVMMVGNHVVGDSRVEKSAVSAARAGNRVTILGSRHRSVFPIGRHGNIPIYRVLNPFLRQVAWNQIHVVEEEAARSLDALFGAETEADRTRLKRAEDDYVAGRGRLTKRIPWIRPLARAAVDVGRSARIQAASRGARRQLRRAAAQGRATVPGGWRSVWPQIADYEESFLRALVDLQPDIIHVHDRHPMAAAAAYAARMHARGQRVPWVYDAHEWLPGQHMSGPEEHRIAWLAAEAELIQRADAVITVSPILAERMKKRHALTELPSVVVNAPLGRRVPMDPGERRPLREECGLGADEPLLVYVGKLAEGRGIYTMVEALPELPGVHVAYVASKDGLIREELKRRAADLGVAERVHIVDYVPAASVTWYVSSATIGMSPLYPTSAHHSAMPTKIREYLQAGLPVVASDLRAQGEFIRKHRVGALHRPKDGASLAAAVRRVLAELDGYRAAIAPELLQEHTWEGEEKVLTQVWHGLVPAEAGELAGDLVQAVPDSAPTRPGPVLAMVEAETSAMAAAWAEHAGPVLDLGKADMSLLLDAAIDRGLRLDQEADAVLLDGGNPVHVQHLGGPLVEARALQAAGKRVGVIASDLGLISGEQALKSNPLHPAADWDPAFLAKNARLVRRTTNLLRDLHLPIFTPSLSDARQFSKAHWCPHPVQVAPDLPADTGEQPRVMVVPLARSAAEEAALSDLAAALQLAGVEVERPRRRGFQHSSASGADIVIDSLTLREYSKAGACAFGVGRIVVGSAPAGLPEAPVVEAGPAELVDLVAGLVRDFGNSRWREIRQASIAYGKEFHDGRRAVEVMREVLAR